MGLGREAFLAFVPVLAAGGLGPIGWLPSYTQGIVDL